ncbi:MAG TPA: TatD family nuclease-associated radical SAM protein [Candidatus Limnocylindrales bacterium]|nr:TatD family nuclease-associated radical SAM protein [Candidatus Limnocylindrales bacterium]
MAKDEKPRTVYWLDNKLYLNITNKCSNCCFFCLKNFRRGVGGFNLKLDEEPTVIQIIDELGQVLAMRNWDEVVFCGFGEPTERLDVLLEVARWIRQHYRRPLRIRVDTNGHGYLLNRGRDVATELKAAGVDKVSVSLNAGDRETYVEVCKPTFAGAYEAVVDFIEKAKPVLQVEATMVRMPEVDVAKAKAVANGLGVEFWVREYIPCFY